LTDLPGARSRRRIVLTTLGSLGDLHPYIALALGLKARGHEPTLATSEGYRHKIEPLGIGFRLTITVEVAYGNVVTGYVGTIHFSSTDNQAALPANYTFKAADKGVHTFAGLVLRITGSVTENVV